MFEGLIRQATTSIEDVIWVYVRRVLVAIPFVIALAFAIAASTFILARRYGATDACLIMTGVFALAGLIASVALTRKRPSSTEPASEAAHVHANGAGSSEQPAAANDDIFEKLATAAGIVSVIGPANLIPVARLLGRHWPIVLLIGLIATLVFGRSQPLADDGALASDTDTAGGAPLANAPLANAA